MNIRILRLALHNFKGVRDAEFRPDGGNARIEGENGTGKSTVFDAFVWLLFGKDHRGQDWTSFDLKPIDPQTREPLHGLEHWVEADLSVDGAKRTLRRVVCEDWVKPRGETEKVMKGHKQTFFVDGVDTVTKKSYDGVILQWIDESVFRLLTNPLHFIDDAYTGWQARRKALVALVQDGDGGAGGALRERFADLLAEMNGEAMEIFRRRIAAEKKANKADLDKSTANISALRGALPEPVDAAGVNAEISRMTAERDAELQRVQAEISAIDGRMADMNAANEGRKAEIDALWKQIYGVRDSMSRLVTDAHAEARKAYDEARGRRNAAGAMLRDLVSRAEAASRSAARADAAVSDLEQEKYDASSELAELGRQYAEARERTFDAAAVGACPVCGQALPEAMMAEKADEFARRRREEMQRIADRAAARKQSIADISAALAGKKAEIDRCTAEMASLKADIEAARKEFAAIPDPVAPDLNAVERTVESGEDFRRLVLQDLELQRQAKNIQADAPDMRALIQERRTKESEMAVLRSSCEERVRPLRDRLAVDGERERLLRMIAEEEKRERAFADEVARLERLEFRASEYVKAEMDSLEESLNGLFRVARWKMFDRTLDGGLTEMCEVTDAAGVPYRSMNDAQRILCGMDVIRVFGERYGCAAPIFVDNAESITRREFDTPAQVIRLVVAEGSELTMYNEAGVGGLQTVRQ